MKILELIRLETSSKEGTFGVLKIDKRVFCLTLEPPQFENVSSVSCIPAQQYEMRLYSSSKYPNTYQIINVPQRSHILFHAGNVVRDTSGCVIVGEKLGILSGARAILNSDNTLSKLREELGQESCHLTITEIY